MDFKGGYCNWEQASRLAKEQLNEEDSMDDALSAT